MTTSLHQRHCGSALEVARCRTFRAGTMDEVRALDFSGVAHLGVTSGASTPESFFREAVAFLSRGRGEV